jgi:heme/copper-type cytochrome/quinol oxidase subunit 2
MEYINAIVIVWLYLIGMWLAYEAAVGDDEDVKMDWLGGVMLIIWPVSYPVMVVAVILFGSKFDPDE